MIILNALYKRPEDVVAFQQHYQNTHMPIVMKTPGLIKAEAEMVTSTFMGKPDDYYMLARMYYKNSEDFKTAMRSEENKTTGKDLISFAKGKVSLYVTEI